MISALKSLKKLWNEQKRSKNGWKKCFEQLSGAASTRKLVEIHNNYNFFNIKLISFYIFFQRTIYCSLPKFRIGFSCYEWKMQLRQLQLQTETTEQVGSIESEQFGKNMGDLNLGSPKSKMFQIPDCLVSGIYCMNVIWNNLVRLLNILTSVWVLRTPNADWNMLFKHFLHKKAENRKKKLQNCCKI